MEQNISSKSKYRSKLPQLSQDYFLTDGGLETTLVFEKKFDLPYFASFPLVNNKKGIIALKEYYKTYIDIALKNKTGIILESPTWRASSDWGKKMGYSESDIAKINLESIRLLQDLQNQFETPDTKIVISLCIGPRGDGYRSDNMMTSKEAEKYHSFQVDTAAESGADLVSAFTMTYSEEAIGIILAAKKACIPAVISFTVETNGLLPSGESLAEAIKKVDDATDNGPAYYMINCAHPTHFENQLHAFGTWKSRIKGIRPNASKKSHAELDESTELDDGDPASFANDCNKLTCFLDNLTILGGCCGTDHRHIEKLSSIKNKLI